MKCEKCGRNDANYHYKTNINGNVKEMHLCSECTAESSEGTDFFTETQQMFDDMFSGFSMFPRRRSISPFESFGFVIPAMMIPRIDINVETSSHPATEPKKCDVEADPKLCRMREKNLLRRQMKKAAAEEDYEKAAELRDKLRELEKAE